MCHMSVSELTWNKGGIIALKGHCACVEDKIVTYFYGNCG